MKRLRTMIMLLMVGSVTFSQQTENVRQAISDLLEPLAEKQLIRKDYSELLDDLVYLYENPLNLNSVTKEDLERIPFLNDYQIENILFYVYNNGPLLSIYELNAVEDLPPETIKQIIPFLTVAPVRSFGEAKKHVTGDLIIRGRTTVQRPEGYVRRSDTVPAAYAGSRERIYSRMQFNYGNRLFAGFTVEKDPGEPMFSEQIPVMDFMSGYIMLKPKGAVKKIILGDYKASFGQGLGLWTGMAFTKSSEVIDIRRRAKNIENYKSVNETSFLRGLAAELEFKDFKLDIFGSYKRIDGTIAQNGITSIRDNGYHRTATELRYRRNLKEKTLGAVLGWSAKKFRIEAGQTFWKIDKPLVNTGALYKNQSFSGDSLYTSFLNYSWFGKKLILFGEIALQNFSHVAVYQGLTWSPGADIQVALSYRNFSKYYFAILSNPFSESSSPNGESGIYFALSFRPLQHLTLNSYIDIYRYKWLKYLTDAPSHGTDLLFQGDYFFIQNLNITLRYKYSEKERNKLFYSGNDFPISTQKQNSFRVRLSYALGQAWWFQTNIEQIFFREIDGHSSDGFMIWFDMKYTMLNNKLTTGLRVAHFDTDDFYSRIYTWEPDVLYAFRVPFFSGNGVRFLLNLSFRPVKNLQFWFRLANTFMSGVEKTGSGYNAVQGNNLTEVKLQMRYRF